MRKLSLKFKSLVLPVCPHDGFLTRAIIYRAQSEQDMRIKSFITVIVAKNSS